MRAPRCAGGMSQQVQAMSGAETPGRARTSVSTMFTRHFEDVYRMVGHLLGPGASDADIEDLTQQVFVAAHRSWDRYRGEGRPTTWLYGIATRVVLSNLRSWRRHRRLIAALELEVQDSVPSAERQAQAKQELARVWRCLMRVRPGKRVVYVLHVVQGRSGEEIAVMLDIPVATVWTRLHHARKELTAGLEREQRRAP